MSAALFPSITSDVCRRYIGIGRRTRNDVSAQIHATLQQDSSVAERRAHNAEAVGSIPTPATNLGDVPDSTQDHAGSCRRTMALSPQPAPQNKRHQTCPLPPLGGKPTGSLIAAGGAGIRTTLADACIPSTASTSMDAASSAMVEVGSAHPSSLCIATSRSSEHAGSTPAVSTTLERSIEPYAAGVMPRPISPAQRAASCSRGAAAHAEGNLST